MCTENNPDVKPDERMVHHFNKVILTFVDVIIAAIGR